MPNARTVSRPTLLAVDLDRVRELWEGNADEWTRGVREGLDVFRDLYNNPAFFAFLGDVAGKRVLDAGCGEGTNTRKLADLGAEVVGIDLSARMIEHARGSDARVDFRVGSMTDLAEFEDESFDLVVSTMALMDTPDLRGALREFARVVRRGGRVVFSITHPCFTNAMAGWEDGETPVLRIAGYVGVEHAIETWRFRAGPSDRRPFEVAYFPRTMTEIVAAVVDAGLRLSALNEPVPSEDACARYPPMRKHRSIPHFLHVAAAR